MLADIVLSFIVLLAKGGRGGGGGVETDVFYAWRGRGGGDSANRYCSSCIVLLVKWEGGEGVYRWFLLCVVLWEGIA